MNLRAVRLPLRRRSVSLDGGGGGIGGIAFEHAGGGDEQTLQTAGDRQVPQFFAIALAFC